MNRGKKMATESIKIESGNNRNIREMRIPESERDSSSSQGVQLHRTPAQ